MFFPLLNCKFLLSIILLFIENSIFFKCNSQNDKIMVFRIGPYSNRSKMAGIIGISLFGQDLKTLIHNILSKMQLFISIKRSLKSTHKYRKILFSSYISISLSKLSSIAWKRFQLHCSGKRIIIINIVIIFYFQVFSF